VTALEKQNNFWPRDLVERWEYTPVLNALFHPALGLDANELLVLVAICGAVYLNRGATHIKAPASFLAHRIGRSATTVERRLKSLEQKGVIRKTSISRPYSYSLAPLFEKLRRLAQVLDAEEGAPPSEPQSQQEEVFLPEEPRAAQFGAPTTLIASRSTRTAVHSARPRLPSR
jgi:DNA-binding MarR family transcriptional regulator